MNDCEHKVIKLELQGKIIRAACLECDKLLVHKLNINWSLVSGSLGFESAPDPNSRTFVESQDLIEL